MKNLFAQVAYAQSRADELVDNIINDIINPIIGLLFGLAFVLFLWGVARFIFRADDEAQRKQGRQHIIWGLVGMFIMVSVRGILELLVNFWL